MNDAVDMAGAFHVDQSRTPSEVVTHYGKLARLNSAIEGMPQTDLGIKHHFAKGVYAREGFIPKGTVIVGRIHTQSQINILSKGDISILTERGVIRMKGPCTFVSPAGAQRAGYAHEDTVFTTILGTDKTDPQEIYDTLTTSTYEDFELACEEMLRLAKEQPCSE